MYIAFINFISEYLIYLFVFPLLFFLLKDDEKTTRNIVFSTVATWLLLKLTNLIWFEPRPFVADPSMLLYPTALTKTDSGFFSFHASTAMAMAMSFFLTHKKLGLIFIVLAFMVAIGRVVSGLHYPVDVLSGLLIGLLVSIAINRANQRLDI